MFLFQSTGVTVTLAPDCVWLPFHRFVTCWPFGKVQVRVHPLIGSPSFLIVTSATNPVPHSFAML